MATAYAIIAGVGEGTGLSIARRFAQAYTVVLLSRTPQSYEPLVEKINTSGGKAIGISADVSNQSSVNQAFEQIKKQLSGAKCSAAIFNASGGFVRKPFLESELQDYEKSINVTLFGAINFSKAALPLLLESKSEKYPPTLIFTGATASMKSSAMMSSFSTGKWALRALAGSLAKEFGPQGVHVSHAIIDGVIDIPKSKEYMSDIPDGKISPDGIAEAYWNLHTQPRSCFTHEIDLRPYCEKW